MLSVADQFPAQYITSRPMTSLHAGSRWHTGRADLQAGTGTGGVYGRCVAERRSQSPVPPRSYRDGGISSIPSPATDSSSAQLTQAAVASLASAASAPVSSFGVVGQPSITPLHALKVDTDDNGSYMMVV